MPVVLRIIPDTCPGADCQESLLGDERGPREAHAPDARAGPKSLVAERLLLHARIGKKLNRIVCVSACRFSIVSGIVPVKAVAWRAGPRPILRPPNHAFVTTPIRTRAVSTRKFPTVSGLVPVKALLCERKRIAVCKYPTVTGIVPGVSCKCRFRIDSASRLAVSASRFPIARGIVPVQSMRSQINGSWSVDVAPRHTEMSRNKSRENCNQVERNACPPGVADELGLSNAAPPSVLECSVIMSASNKTSTQKRFEDREAHGIPSKGSCVPVGARPTRRSVRHALEPDRRLRAKTFPSTDVQEATWPRTCETRRNGLWPPDPLA